MLFVKLIAAQRQHLIKVIQNFFALPYPFDRQANAKIASGWIIGLNNTYCFDMQAGFRRTALDENDVFIPNGRNDTVHVRFAIRRVWVAYDALVDKTLRIALLDPENCRHGSLL